METNVSQIGDGVIDSNSFFPLLFTFNRLKVPFSREIFFWIDVIVRITLTGNLALFGVVTNVINALLFHRQGILSDGSTVSLFGLAISEIFSNFFYLFSVVYLSIMRWAPDYSDWSWSVNDFYLATAIRPRTIFTQITCWITAFIAIERFISVVFPFKVKQIVTPARSCFVVASIFVCTIILFYPQYSRLTITKTSGFWGTQLEYLEAGLISESHYNTFLLTHIVSLRMVSVAIVLCCNIVIMWVVVISAKFRKTSTGTEAGKNRDGNSEPSNTDATSAQKGDKNSGSNVKSNRDNKEKRLLRMMVIICVLFLICTTPDVIFSYILYAEGIKYHYFIKEIAFAFSTLLEVISSSINIFVYYSLSTRYRKEFRLCCIFFYRNKK